MSSTTRRPSRSIAALAALCVIACSYGLAGDVVPADAQAARVHVSVRTSPALPAPGDDVAARVSISGCPPGGALIETFLTFDDGASQTSVRVARTAAQSSLLFSSNTVVQLHAAIEGWYGVRVICGDFRPARAPMTNSLFLVGATSTKTALVSTPNVVQGATFGYHGTGCKGARIEYSMYQVERNATPFTITGTIPVQADGTWLANLAVPSNLKPGPARIRARCVNELASGDKAYVYYSPDQDVTVVAAGAPPATTKISAP